MRRPALAALAVLGLAGSAAASPLRVDEVFAGLDAHPLVTSARAGVDRARGELEAAHGAFDLRLRARGDHAPFGYYDRITLDGELRKLSSVRGLSAFVGWRLGTGAFPDYDLKLATLERGELRAGLELPLLRDGAIDRARADVRRATAAGVVARAERGRRELELARDAAAAYWDWVAAGQRLAIRTRQVGLARDRDRGLRRSIAEGDTAPIDAVDNSRLIAARETQVIASRRDVERAALVLSLFHRDAAGDPVVSGLDRLPDLGPLPDPLPTEAEDRVSLAEMRARQPILAAFDARLTANAADLDLATNQLLPSLNAMAYTTRGIGAPDLRLPDRSITSFGIGFTFELPLERRQAKGALAVARADRVRLVAEQRFAAEQLELEVRAAAIELRAARKRVELAIEQEGLANQLADAERQRFARGDSTILVVNLREEAAADASVARVEATAEYLKSRARYQVALGRPAKEWR